MQYKSRSTLIRFNVNCITRCMHMIVCNGHGCLSVNVLELLNVVFGIGIPYSCTVIQYWSYMCSVSYVWYLVCSCVDFSSGTSVLCWPCGESVCTLKLSLCVRCTSRYLQGVMGVNCCLCSVRCLTGYRNRQGQNQRMLGLTRQKGCGPGKNFLWSCNTLIWASVFCGLCYRL